MRCREEGGGRKECVIERKKEKDSDGLSSLFIIRRQRKYLLSIEYDGEIIFS